MKILLLEDNLVLQELFQFNLEALDCEVMATDNVEDALTIYSDFPADIVLSDIDLKGRTKGYEIIDLLAKKYAISPPVVLMSGGDSITKEKAMRLGAKNFLVKPFNFREICLDLQHITLLNKLTNSLLDELAYISKGHSIGIRILKGDDYPYYKYKGFSKEFIMQEKFLCGVDPGGNKCLECMCGNVIEGRFDPCQSFFTKKGNFYSNHTTELLATTSEEDRLANTRNYCNKAGYESVALIAIRDKNRCYGLLQLNDFAKNKFSDIVINAVEHLADDFAKKLEYIV